MSIPKWSWDMQLLVSPISLSFPTLELNRNVKNLLDPSGILAPYVKLTRKQDIHLQNFKRFPKIEQEINSCVECGFCEPVCPSRHVTLTPCQRIVLRRVKPERKLSTSLLASIVCLEIPILHILQICYYSKQSSN
ncbi:hypothetical protein CD31A_1231 [Corynebacterium diphtheriae 31A]|nr:hypothetical protein CD31A_1231 [Corynebacterium diphtheriae 31A]